MKTSEKLREKLFNIYSTNLDLVVKHQKWKIGHRNNNGDFEEAQTSYICPICSRLFVVQSLNQSITNPLTLEDVPPKSLGGKPIILSCKNCNNKLGGAKLDSSLKHSIEVEPFTMGEPNSKIDAYYEINKRTKVKGKFVFLEKNKFWMDFNPKSNPNITKELDQLVEQWNGSSIKVNMRVPSKRLASLALLKVAYFKLFTLFGYSYFFSKSAMQIRNQLRTPEEKSIPVIGVPKLSNNLEGIEGIFFIKSPPTIKSYLVIFKLIHNKQAKFFPIIMPGPDEDYNDLIDRVRKLGKFNLNLICIANLNFLTEKKRILAYHEIWNQN